MALAEVDMNGIDENGEEFFEVKKKDKNTKRLSVERIYQKKTQLEHILLRPDSYIGSVEPCQQDMWIYDSENDIIIHKNITFTPGLYKIFDEIIVNAADNKQRDNRMNMIKVDIDVEKNIIRIWNNGKGIPVEMHKEQKMYVPTMIFGHLLTSSNYDDTDKKVVGGRNGFGAKLCNIFSTKFTVETATNGKKFKQVWRNNMGKVEEPKVTEYSGTDYTCITFSPDLPKFKMEKLDDDFVALLKRRAYDIAGVARGVNVTLNGDKLKIRTFKDYVQLHLKGVALSRKVTDEDKPEPKIVHEIINPRWEVCVTVSETGFQQCSFVNSIATTKGGTHVNYLVDQITEKLIQAVKKKQGKGGFNIKPFQVKSHLWVFANTLIENPTFDSQTKENMTLRKTSFGSVCDLSDKYIKQVQDCGVLENIMSWVKFKSEAQLNKKTYSSKHSKLKGIPKLDDANDAGTKNSRDCTLIVTEGDSAKALAVAGLGVVGRDKYGVFPLKGKMLNVRDATHKQIMENAEVGHLLKIIGLQFGKKYKEEDLKTLRYGHLMIMADQDVDGSHIKGLVINFIHASWPELLKLDFLEEFITPIVKVTKGNESQSFYSLPELEEWKENTANHKSWKTKYYKGLGTSTSKEGKEYFSNLRRHRITFEYDGPASDQAIVLAFSKKLANDRKNWLTQMMEESKLRKEAGLPAVYLYEKDTRSVTYRDFVNKELVLFSNADNERSIPSLVDGLKPGQRKVLFTVMKRNDKNEVKVAQLAGAVAEMSAYHHGEASLMGTIVNLAQNFVGSNNLNLLEPHGQFGTRNLGGKDSASPRYIFTKMSSLTRLIFPVHDDYVLNFLQEDNLKIEPDWYCPIIPMVLINGAEGIGTGYSTKVPNYDIRELVEIVKSLIAGEEPIDEVKPSYKNFTGEIERSETHKYSCSGVISIIDDTTVEISELPVKCWTQSYKESVMDILLYGNDKVQPCITDYKEYHTDTTVKFVVTMTEQQMAKAEQDGLHKLFKLDTSFSTSSMVLFDEYGCIRKFNSVLDIIKSFYQVRLQVYQKRRLFMIGMLEAECSKLENQARFILEKIEGKIVIENRAKRDIVTTLVERGFNSDPVKVWKASVDADADDENDDRLSIFDAASSVSSASGGPDFQYLLTMPIMSMSKEKKEELLKQRDDKNGELETLRNKTPETIWLDELEVFSEELDRVEEQERLDERESSKIKKAGAGKTAKGRVVKRPAPKPVEPKPAKVTKTVKKTEKENEQPGESTEDSKPKGEVLSLADRLKKSVGGAKGGAKKQTTLSFKKAPKKKYGSDSEDSEDDFKPVSSEIAPAPERSMRQKEAKKYVVDLSDDDDEDDIDDKSTSSESSPVAEVASASTNGHEEANTEEAETRALIEKLSPMKKKVEKPVTKPSIPKRALDVSSDDEPSKKKKINTYGKNPTTAAAKSSMKFSDTSDDEDVVRHPVGDEESPSSEAAKKPAPKKTSPNKPPAKGKKTTAKDDASDESDGMVITDEEPKKTTKKPAAKPKKTKAKKSDSDDESEFSDSEKSKKKTKKQPAAKPKKTKAKKSDSDDESEFSDGEKSKKKTKKQSPKKPAKKPAKKANDSDESDDAIILSDDDKPKKKTKTSPKKAAAKKGSRKKSRDSDDDDDESFNVSKEASKESPLPIRERAGRNARNAATTKKKYSFSSSEDEDDSDDFC